MNEMLRNDHIVGFIYHTANSMPTLFLSLVIFDKGHPIL
jgi:hypothetical protein